MVILQQNKAGLEKYVTNRKNPGSISGIYLNTTKVVHYRLLTENATEEEKAKK